MRKFHSVIPLVLSASYCSQQRVGDDVACIFFSICTVAEALIRGVSAPRVRKRKWAGSGGTKQPDGSIERAGLGDQESDTTFT